MNEKIIVSPPSSSVRDKVYDGIIDENTYYSCHIADLSSLSGKELIDNLSKGNWDDPTSNPIDKNLQRGISHFKDFNIDEINGDGIIFCYGDVTVDRKKESTTSNTNLPETNLDVKELPYQMSQKDLMDFLKIPTGMDNQAKKEYAPKIIKVKSLKTDPTCPECNGTGKSFCHDCYGIGDGVCPDCEGTGSFLEGKPGKEGTFCSRVTGKYLRLYFGESCPTCKGRGSFDCEYCNQTGEIVCPVCRGKGEIKNENSQKVTKVLETYYLNFRGEVYLPDNEYLSFNPFLVKETLLKSKNRFYFNPLRENNISFHVEKKNEALGVLSEEINQIVENKNIFYFQYFADEIPGVKILKYKYDSEDYQIIILGDYAFTKDIPSISFMEQLTRSFKKKIQ